MLKPFKRVRVALAVLLVAVCFTAIPQIALATVSVTFTNGCPTSDPYHGVITFQFASGPDASFSNLPSGTSILTMPAEPISMTINGSVADRTGAIITFEDVDKTGVMWFDSEGNLWHAEK